MKIIIQAADGTVRLLDDGIPDSGAAIPKLDYVDQKVLQAYAESNMRAKVAAKQLGTYWNLVYRRLDSIWDKTGLDPHNFYDLHKLLQLIKKEGR